MFAGEFERLNEVDERRRGCDREEAQDPNDIGIDRGKCLVCVVGAQDEAPMVYRLPNACARDRRGAIAAFPL